VALDVEDLSLADEDVLRATHRAVRADRLLRFRAFGARSQLAAALRPGGRAQALHVSTEDLAENRPAAGRTHAPRLGISRPSDTSPSAPLFRGRGRQTPARASASQAFPDRRASYRARTA